MGFHVTSGGLIHRPDKDVLVSCLFAGKAVECTRREIECHNCDKCGWNPVVAVMRMERMK